MSKTSLFSRIERFKHPATILWRSIEINLLKEQVSGKILDPSNTVLDLGCGEGLIANIIFGKKISFGLDNEPDMVKKAKKSDQYNRVIYADASKHIPLKSNSIDLVFSNSVIEHIPNIDGTLEQVHHILKKEGYFIFTVPNNQLTQWSMVSKYSNMAGNIYGAFRNRKFNHYHLYTIKQWEKLLNKHGLIIENSYTFLDQQTIELWDYLLWTGKFIKIIDRHITRKIFKCYTNAKTLKNGAATTIIAINRG